MNTLTGSIYPVTIESVGATFELADRKRYFSLTTSSALQFFNKFAIEEQSISDNQLGLYSHIVLDREDRARFASLTSPAHVYSSRKNGCTWNPKGKMTMNVSEFDVCPIQLEMQLCPDSLWGTCMERIFNSGKGILDLMGTPEGVKLMDNLVFNVYRGRGNSMNELAWYAEHPDIETINASGFYKTSAEDWAAYYDQEMSGKCGGWMTQMDALKTAGNANYNVSIPNASFAGSNPVSGAYTGDIIALLDSLIAAANPDFQNAIEYGVRGNSPLSRDGRVFPVIKLTAVLYRAYQKYIQTTYPALQEAYNYQMSLNDGRNINIIGTLRYHNLAISKWEEVGRYDFLTGTTSHRAAIFMPGVLGLATDVRTIPGSDGNGLEILQRLDMPFKGMVYMSEYLKWGAGIGDINFIVSASNITLPTA